MHVDIRILSKLLTQSKGGHFRHCAGSVFLYIIMKTNRLRIAGFIKHYDQSKIMAISSSLYVTPVIRCTIKWSQ